MRKILLAIIIILGVGFSFVVLDTLQAVAFKKSPFISKRYSLKETNNYIDKGIILNTYYCHDEITWHFKYDKYNCPEEKIDDENN